MKFALFDFFEEGTVEIGSTDMICLDENDPTVNGSNYNNEKWESTKEVLVKWPSKKGPKSSTQLHVAKVVYFADDRRDRGMLAKRDELTAASPAPSTSSAEDSNKRKQKRPQRYASDEENSSDELCASNTSSKPKVKKVKIVKRDDMLVDRLVKKKEAAKKIEQQPQQIDSVINENRSLKEENLSLKVQLTKVTKERDGAVSSLACIRELPDLLHQIKSLRKPSTSGFSCYTPIRQSTTQSCLSDEKNRPLSPKQHAATSSTSNYTAPKFLQDLMTKTFGREEMATHSLTGSCSNANGAVEAKPQLNCQKMDEIFDQVKSRFPSIEMKYLKEAARNKLSNERKMHKRAMSKRV